MMIMTTWVIVICHGIPMNVIMLEEDSDENTGTLVNKDSKSKSHLSTLPTRKLIANYSDDAYMGSPPNSFPNHPCPESVQKHLTRLLVDLSSLPFSAVSLNEEPLLGRWGNGDSVGCGWCSPTLGTTARASRESRTPADENLKLRLDGSVTRF